MSSPYISEPMSRHDLRNIAHVFLEKLGLEKTIYFPVTAVLETLHLIFPNFSFEIVEDEELPKNVQADTDAISGHIRIRNSVYERACEGSAIDRMTITHEISHFLLLRICSVKFQRNNDNEVVLQYRDPEWQAGCLAGEIMVNSALTSDFGVKDIQEKCGVSYTAACKQYSAMHRSVKPKEGVIVEYCKRLQAL